MSEFVVFMPAGAEAQHFAVPLDPEDAHDPQRLMTKVLALVGDKVAIQIKIKSPYLSQQQYVAYCGRVQAENQQNMLARKFLDEDCIATGNVVLLGRKQDGSGSVTVTTLSDEECDLVAI